MRPWRNKNAGVHPSDPAYIDDYDAEADFENWEREAEEKYEYERERKWEEEHE